jgi:hypothetical protein
MNALVLEDHAAPRFTRVFLVVLLLGLALRAAVAVVVDPTDTFGTGRLPSMLTGERDTKPAAFRTLEPPPRALVIGSSRVTKFRPSCIEELTGLPTFNFGITRTVVEDLAAAYGFARAHARAPIRELIIGIDVEAFDNHAVVDPRLRAAAELRPYVEGGHGLSFDDATRALFGWQGLRLAWLSVWYQLQPSARPPARVSYSPDGFVTYNIMEAEMRAGTYSQKLRYEDMAKALRDVRGTQTFTALSEPRVALFRKMIATANADGTTVDVVIMPIVKELEPVRDRAGYAARTRELDTLLGELERAGMIRYLRITRVEDFGGDPNGYFDGAHMTEANSSRLLLAMFHRAHGCGL